jgi:amino acid permease
MKEKFFGMVGFIFDAIKVMAAIVVIFFALTVAVSIYRISTQL